MISPVFIMIAVFIGVAALVGGVMIMMREKPASRVEDRLDVLTGKSSVSDNVDVDQSITKQSQGSGFFDEFLQKYGNLSRFIEQSDTGITVSKLVAISTFLMTGGFVVCLVLQMHIGIIPFFVGGTGSLPLLWVWNKRRKRLKQFATQLPDAMEMLARALRAGQSLQFGFQMIAEEMPAPISQEFGRVFEEQNLGIALDDSLADMTERIPNLDLKFFATAVILQRQTGGDLAEILDKIGELIRERFRIWGQVQALTGEGRLSGAVLLALPVVLFFVIFYLNPGYVKPLFTDPLGKKMLFGAIVMQILGAVAIKKIITIEV